MLVSLMWAKTISVFIRRNESRDLFQDHDLCFSDHDCYPVIAVVATG